VKTILLVEDGRFLRVMNERALVRAGYRVMTACDGEEALRLAAESVPDLVLLDMLLPKLSGPEVLRSLRANSKTAQVPIVVLSSLPQSNEAQLRKDGATAYLDKSTLGLHEHSESLVQVVKRILDEHAERAGDAVSLPPVLLVGPVEGGI
jgi:chemosensory pili system protein ChpA (sensor histidine kinase/response regulator)